MRHYNRRGKHVRLKDLKIKDPKFEKTLENGSVIPDWTEENDHVDGNGFDKGFRGTHGYVNRIFLRKGYRVARFGTANGRLFAPVGSEYDKLGLPYVFESIQYHEYIVIKPFEVRMGKVAPMFDSVGGAWQFYQRKKIRWLVKHGYLKEDFRWLVTARANRKKRKL